MVYHNFVLLQGFTLSTQLFTSVAGASETYSFVQARAAYRKEIASLRKEFIEEEKRRKEKRARDAEAQRQSVIKAKAVRLQIKRQQQAIRAKEVAREKKIYEEKVRVYFEEKVVVRQERKNEVERRREALVTSLRQQSAKWTTEENYLEKLKEDVFIYSPNQISVRGSFDPCSTSMSAMSWLEKLQRMKPAGMSDSDEADASTISTTVKEDASRNSSDAQEENVDVVNFEKKEE
ncbi:hypothetical protein PsorP6_005773 [Peronosclerospora sorghi]|uniref:Uncharacterized protein n=1 Tax=Peronosclerospora sorghi TaxID=230839 RepID=A0ACC0W6Y9_9STRA|nr:hypothetical protein PsorP6_005773 [Peronosclerospora sorghi]